MKKKISLTFYFIFFFAILLIEIYCLLEYRKDRITIIGISIAFLIATYLLIDSIKHEIIDKYKKFHNKIQNEYIEMNEKLEARYEEIIKLEKAIYVAIKKSNPDNKSQMKEKSME